MKEQSRFTHCLICLLIALIQLCITDLSDWRKEVSSIDFVCRGLLVVSGITFLIGGWFDGKWGRWVMFYAFATIIFLTVLFYILCAANNVDSGVIDSLFRGNGSIVLSSVLHILAALVFDGYLLFRVYNYASKRKDGSGIGITEKIN